MANAVLDDNTTFADIMSEPLTAEEKQERKLAEAAIRKAAAAVVRADAAYVEAGRAFQQIRDGKLYRETHKDFTLYCKETWRVGKSKVYRLIDASCVAKILSPIGEDFPLPTKESVARELVPLLGNPAKLVSAWEHAVQEAEDHGQRRITANWLRRWLRENMVITEVEPASILNHSADKPGKPGPTPKPATPGDDLLGTPSAGPPVIEEDPWFYVQAALDAANVYPKPGVLRPPMSDARRKMLIRGLKKAIQMLEGDSSEDSS